MSTAIKLNVPPQGQKITIDNGKLAVKTVQSVPNVDQSFGGAVTIAERPGFAEVRFHKLGTDAAKDPVVHPATGSAKTFIGGGISRDGHWLVVSIQHGWNATDVLVKDVVDADVLVKNTDVLVKDVADVTDVPLTRISSTAGSGPAAADGAAPVSAGAAGSVPTSDSWVCASSAVTSRTKSIPIVMSVPGSTLIGASDPKLRIVE